MLVQDSFPWQICTKESACAQKQALSRIARPINRNMTPTIIKFMMRHSRCFEFWSTFSFSSILQSFLQGVLGLCSSVLLTMDGRGRALIFDGPQGFDFVFHPTIRDFSDTDPLFIFNPSSRAAKNNVHGTMLV